MNRFRSAGNVLFSLFSWFFFEKVLIVFIYMYSLQFISKYLNSQLIDFHFSLKMLQPKYTQKLQVVADAKNESGTNPAL